MHTPNNANRHPLLAAAHAYLADAANQQLSTHTRLSSAMNALGTLCTAGLGSDADRRAIEAWERARYDVAAWPTEEQVADAVRYVSQMLRNLEART